MSQEPHDDRAELLRLARAHARRALGRLREDRDDLARRRPGDVRGGEALRDATAAAERLCRALENSSSDPPQPPAADDGLPT